MRRICLIRHGHPDFAFHAHMCLGRTDTPLGAFGRMQAALLGEALKDVPMTVFSSPLSRCLQTAAPFCSDPVIVEELAEQDMGVWDGMDFDTIRAQWGDLYARRREEPLLVPPGAETLEQVCGRVLPAIDRCLESCRGDIALVTHSSVSQTILAKAAGLPLEQSRPLRPPYASVTILDADDDMKILQSAFRPVPELTVPLAEKLLAAAAPGERIDAHSRAVADMAVTIADAIPIPLDRTLLTGAALLHDIARTEKDHAELGAAWLRELGYDRAAALVGSHHDLKSDAVDETAVLFLADKCVREDRIVSLEERFAESEIRCLTSEAKASHAKRREAAFALRERINDLCGQKIIS